MSNLPKIHGTCDAGCLWETIHREEFNRAATYVPIPTANGEVRVDPYHKYKIKYDRAAGAESCSVKAIWYKEGEESERTIELALTDGLDKYRDYFYFEALGFDEDGLQNATIEYEVNGNSLLRTLGQHNGQIKSYILVGLLIKGATEIYLYNADAEILVEGLPFVTEADNGKFLRVANGAWAAVALTDVSQEGA